MDELAQLPNLEKMKADLFGGLPYFFESDTEILILQKAKDLFLEKLKTAKSPDSAWSQVVASFHRENHWGFPVTTAKPKKVDSEDTKNAKEAFSYLWTAVQATLILKVVIYFFGLRLAQDNTPENWAWFLGSLSFSWGSLFFFAWRKHRKKEWEKSEPS